MKRQRRKPDYHTRCVPRLDPANLLKFQAKRMHNPLNKTTFTRSKQNSPKNR